jgi:hypothetical protein
LRCADQEAGQIIGRFSPPEGGPFR